MDDHVLPGLLRRIRRLADLSQRELAEAAGIATAALGRAEAGGDLRVAQLVRIVRVAGLRLAVLDQGGRELAPMTEDAVRDGGRRLFPAHLDTRHGDEDWWGGPHRPHLRNPRYTFDRGRSLRDRRRAAGVASDHLVPTPGDSLEERAAARRDAENQARAAERARRFLAGELTSPPDPPCTCQSGCEYAERVNEDLTHAPECACRCDVS